MSKRVKELKEKIDSSKNYSLEEALELIKEAPTKFDQSVELHLHLGIDPQKGDQMIRSSVVLPHGTGQTKKIMAFVTADKEAEAKEAGADFIGNEDTIQQIKTTGKIEFDVAVAIPQMMKNLGPIAKTLGQKGLMPNPKTETVGPDIKKIIESLKKGKITFKNDDTANVHQLVGKLSFDTAKLTENINTFLEAVKKVKPDGLKGTYIKSATICTTMGPGVKIKVS